MSTLVLFLAFALPMAGQSAPSIQGVWRAVELTIPPSTAPAAGVANQAAGRRDPFGAFSEGTHTALQPELMIFTGKHYSRTTDTGARPRPTTGYKTAGKPTLEELQAEWGPFVANAGTYEVSGSTLTLHAIVAKNPRAQHDGNFTKLAIRLEGNNLWLTPIETEAGRIGAPVTSKFVRIE
jgi:hypothetical protein